MVHQPGALPTGKVAPRTTSGVLEYRRGQLENLSQSIVCNAQKFLQEQAQEAYDECGSGSEGGVGAELNSRSVSDAEEEESAGTTGGGESSRIMMVEGDGSMQVEGGDEQEGQGEQGRGEQEGQGEQGRGEQGQGEQGRCMSKDRMSEGEQGCDVGCCSGEAVALAKPR